MCHIWNHFSPKDLCSKRPFDRLDLLREISLFTSDCPNSSANVHLSELFRLNWSKIKTSHDLLSATEHLKDGENGKDCLLSSVDSTKCLKCFHNIGTKLEKITYAYNIFNKTLHRFDCMLAVDSASATRPFSPNGTCVNCKVCFFFFFNFLNIDNITKKKKNLNSFLIIVFLFFFLKEKYFYKNNVFI